MLSLSTSLFLAPLPAMAAELPVSAGSVASGIDQTRGWQPKADEADVKVDRKSVV